MGVISVFFAIVLSVNLDRAFGGSPVFDVAPDVDLAEPCMYSLTGWEDYTFLPTTNAMNGYPVYQAVDKNTCQGLNRFMYRWKSGNGWYIDDFLAESDRPMNRGRVGFIRSSFEGCVVDADVTFIAHGGKEKNSKLQKLDSSSCFPTTRGIMKTPPLQTTELGPADKLPVNASYDCVYRLSGHENYTFLPTKILRNRYPMYQAVDNETCQPLNRYLYRWLAESGYEWNIDHDLVESGHAEYGGRLGYVDGNVEGCVAKTVGKFWYKRDGPNAEFHYWQTAKLEKIEGPPCFVLPTEPHIVLPSVVGPADEHPVDEGVDCLYRLTGFEEYTLLPTTTTKNGYPVYQGVHNETCQRLNRYLYRSLHNNKSEWYIDHEIVESATSEDRGNVGYVVSSFEGCVGKVDVFVWDNGVYGKNSKLQRIRCSPCFPGCALCPSRNVVIELPVTTSSTTTTPLEIQSFVPN